MLELLKLVVQPVVLERDDEGNVVGERLGNPSSIYSQAELDNFFSLVQDELVQANEPKPE